MEYTVYAHGGEARVSEEDVAAAPLPPGAAVALVTTDRAEAAVAVGELVARGHGWAGNDWLTPAEFYCGKCQAVAEPDGEGSFRHADPMDAAACLVMFGDEEMARYLLEEL